MNRKSKQSDSSDSFWRAEIDSLEIADIGDESGHVLPSGPFTGSGQIATIQSVWQLVLFGLAALTLGYLIGKLDS